MNKPPDPFDSISPADLARRIGREVADVLSSSAVDNDQRFREEMLTRAVRTEVKLDALIEDFDSHKQEDRQNFTAVTMQIGGSKDWINKAAGAITLAVFLTGFIGLITWLIDRVHPK